AAVAARGALCVGIDPHASLLRAWGLPDDPHGLAEFTRTVVSALADRVAVLKPQMAFFERFGSRGIAVLEEAVARARAAGALVLRWRSSGSAVTSRPPWQGTPTRT